MKDILKEISDLDTMDLDLKSHGSELDRDDDHPDGQDFKELMYDQLGKILDTQTGNKPIDTVTTDDGKTFKISPDQARALRMLLTIDGSKVKPAIKAQFTKDIQTSAGLADFADIKDYHEIGQLFIKRYLG